MVEEGCCHNQSCSFQSLKDQLKKSCYCHRIPVEIVYWMDLEFGLGVEVEIGIWGKSYCCSYWNYDYSYLLQKNNLMNNSFVVWEWIRKFLLDIKFTQSEVLILHEHICSFHQLCNFLSDKHCIKKFCKILEWILILDLHEQRNTNFPYCICLEEW